MNQMPKVSDVNATLTTLAINAEPWIIHVGNTIVVAHPMDVANLMEVVLHSVSALMDGPDPIAKLTLMNVLTDPMIVLLMQPATTLTEVMNAHVEPDMKATEESAAKDAQIPMNVSSKVITVVLNQSASTTMVASHANVNQDSLATHQLSDVPNQMKHHLDVNDSPMISTLTI
jgi:hypothetical protein